MSAELNRGVCVTGVCEGGDGSIIVTTSERERGREIVLELF